MAAAGSSGRHTVSTVPIAIIEARGRQHGEQAPHPHDPVHDVSSAGRKKAYSGGRGGVGLGGTY